MLQVKCQASTSLLNADTLNHIGRDARLLDYHLDRVRQHCASITVSRHHPPRPSMTSSATALTTAGRPLTLVYLLRPICTSQTHPINSGTVMVYSRRMSCIPQEHVYTRTSAARSGSPLGPPYASHVAMPSRRLPCLSAMVYSAPAQYETDDKCSSMTPYSRFVSVR